MDLDETLAVIIDNGSYSCKAGLAGDDAPRSVFPSVIGRSRTNKNTPDLAITDCYVGDRAQQERDTLTLSYPIHNGVVTDWDDMEKIWHHAYADLGVNSEDQPVLITEPPFNPNSNRETMTEVLFEKFKAPALYVAIPAHLSVYANGRVSSIVYDCGEGVSHVLLVYEGHTIPQATQRSNIAGSDVTSKFGRFLGERGDRSFTTSAEMEIVRDMKEKFGYVALDFEREMSKSAEEYECTYTLPDGKEIVVGNERFRSTECIFDPSSIGLDELGAHELIHKCLQHCDISMRADLFVNILMSGGTTMFSGFSERMTKEMGKVLPKNTRFKVISPPERKYSVWIGGSILTSLSTFQTCWITRQMYEEEGSTVVHKKCIRFQESR